MKLSVMAPLVRRSIAIISITFSLYLIWLFTAPALKQAYLSLFPPKDLPNQMYGALDPLLFQAYNTLNTNPDYILNTKTGGLPSGIPNKMTVYKFISPAFSYSAGKQARLDAEKLGFNDSMIVGDIQGDIYKWKNDKNSSNLKVTIYSRELELNSNLQNAPELYEQGLTTGEALNAVKNKLKQIGRFNDQLYIDGTSTIKLGKFDGTRIISADSYLEAQIARVDFFRSIGRGSTKYKILNTDSKKGLLSSDYINLPKDSELLSIPKMEANQWEIDPQSNATYPIINVAQAWDAVKNNKGTISNISSRYKTPFEDYSSINIDKILINDIYLAYLDTKVQQKYLLPMYVFEGNFTAPGGETGEITIYYPAIPSESTKQPEPLPAVTK